jgi:sugar phosphate permease
MGVELLFLVQGFSCANAQYFLIKKEYIEDGRRHSTHQHLIPLKIIFKNRTLWAIMCMYFCFQWSNYFFVAWMPVYLQEGRHFTEQQTSPIIFSLFIAGIIGLLSGGFFGDWIVRKKGLKFGRRFVGFTGMGMCGSMIFFAALITQNQVSAACLIAANFSYSFAVMTSYAVCSDIGRNNTGTVTGAMNFFGQMGAFFLALMFGKIADLTHSFNYPLFIVAFVTLTGCMLWLVIDPTKQVAVENGDKQEMLQTAKQLTEAS